MRFQRKLRRYRGSHCGTAPAIPELSPLVQFVYFSPNGPSGVQAYRLEEIEPPSAPQDMVSALQNMLQGESDRVYFHPDGHICTICVIQLTGKFFARYRYSLILEHPENDIYSVFYVTPKGSITWIAGPPTATFSEFWSRVTEMWRKQAH